MMILAEVLLRFVVTLVGVIVTYLVYLVVRNEIAYRRFKSICPNIPIVPGRNLLTGHTNSFFTADDNCKTFSKYHELLGKTYAFIESDRVHVSTIDLDVIKKLVITDSNINRPDTKIPAPEYVEDSISTSKGNQWKRIRRAFGPALSSHKVKSDNVQKDIRSVISNFVEAIEERLQKAKEEKGSKDIEINCEDFFQRYTLDLLFTCFYKQPNRIDYYSTRDNWQETHETAEKAVTTSLYKLSYNFPILYYLCEWFLRFDIHPIGKIRTRLMKIIEDQAKEYFKVRKENESYEKFHEAQHLTLKDGSKFRRNLTDIMIEPYYNGTLTRREYLHSSFFLANATYKTTSDVLSRLIYHLAEYPKVQEKLRESTLVDGVESRYLEFVIDETLRLYPPVPIGCSREISIGDIKTDLGIVPKGASIYTPLGTIHCWPEYWGEDAKEFKPERWENQQHIKPLMYMPFGVGKRVCPGADFALNEMKSLITTLLSKFIFHSSSKPANLNDFYSPAMIFLVSKSPIYVKISLINDEELQ